MRRAVVSDVHANLAALEAVLADVEARGLDSIVCLGDRIGYGPDPVECLERYLALQASGRLEAALLGNHEEAVLSGLAPAFHEAARRAVLWTRAQLAPGWLAPGGRRAAWEFLETNLPSYEADGCVFVHASPRDPTQEYVLPRDARLPFEPEPPDKLRAILASFEGVCFVGHTHMPGLFDASGRFRTPEALGGEIRLEAGEKAIVNVGSAGSPRDGDPRACYVSLETGGDSGVVRWHRVEYDAGRTADRIRGVGELDPRIAERLLAGR